MATYNKEDNIKWNDLSTSLQDIIMRKITWNMLHPDLQSWLLDKERRINKLERWRRTKADPMLDDHENRISVCESEISNLCSKLSDAEDQMEHIAINAIGAGNYKIYSLWFSPDTTGIINPDVIEYHAEITASFKLTPGFTSGIVEVQSTLRFDVLFTHNVQNFIHIPVGPIVTNSLDAMHRHYGMGGGGDVVFSSNSEFYWNPPRLFDVFPCKTDPLPTGHPGTLFRPCFPYATFYVKTPNNYISVQISGYTHYNSLDVKTFKTFDVSKLYNIYDAGRGYFYSLPNPRDMITSIIVI